MEQGLRSCPLELYWIKVPENSVHPDKYLLIHELYLTVISYVQRKIREQLCSHQSMIQQDQMLLQIQFKPLL